MNFKKIIFSAVGILCLLIGLFIFLNNPPSDMQDRTFLIKKGESLYHVASRLRKHNLINNDLFFVYLAYIERKSNILSGKYKINRGMSSRDILKKFASGDIMRRRVTIPEGFNLYEIAERLSENEITSADEFLKYSFDPGFLRTLGIDRNTAEGLLFPDTYTFAESENPGNVIMIMHKQFKSIVDSIDFSNSKKYKLNNYEVIKLASLIEEEAKVSSERFYISAVFHNRLKRNIRLYCDPTIRYALKKFRDRLTHKDLRYDSPYNTYLYNGLPPTPICSPGKESIAAALNPAESGYLYFVSRNDGSHYFSKTLKEHNKAVEFYQKGIRNGFTDRQKL